MDYGNTYCRYLSVLERYFEASWTIDKDDYSSTSGRVFMLGEDAVFWDPRNKLI